MIDILTKEVEDPPSKTSQPSQVSQSSPNKFPKGIVLGKDGKPCRSCTSFASWASMTKKETSSRPATSSSTPLATTEGPPPNCPPDVDALGNSTWNLLHTMTANYPESAPPPLQTQMRDFLCLFSQLYPCWVCADDFRAWMGKRGNEPKLGGRGEFGKWMCEAHNEVNRKLGKEVFDCGKWEERWRTGWKDGRCE